MPPESYASGDVLPGTVYRVVRHLATGGMGSVYDVEDTTVEKRYVLKTLHPQLVSREDLARRMRDEARSLAKLHHPNIVAVVTAGVTAEPQRVPFYVMERLVGQNLRAILGKHGALGVAHALHIASDIADALAHAHDNAIVHRDVKPENIFLHRNANGTTTTKLLDFGIVRLLDRNSSNTRGQFIGTLRYASPEQIAARPIGPPSDVYSLGVVLYEMLAGVGPFDDAGDAYAIGAAHANAPAPPLARFARVDPELERVVMAALEKDPARRPASAASLASALRRVLARVEDAPPPPVTPRAAASAGEAPTLTEPASLAATTVPLARDASPIAPTYEVRATPPGGYVVRPTPPERPVDRDAPTRASAENVTERMAQNDTRLLDAFGETVALVVPSDSARSLPSAPQTPPPSASAPAPRRSPPTAVVLVLAAVVAALMIAGAFALVRRMHGERGSPKSDTFDRRVP